MTQDTRKDRRVKIVSLNVRYKSATVDEFIENHAHDVSRGGIFIKTGNPFPPGTLLKFEIRLASDQAVIAGVGRIVWKRDAGASSGERPAGMGVKFIKIDEPSKVVIDRLMNTRVDAGKSFETNDDIAAAPEGVAARTVPPGRSRTPAAGTAVGAPAGVSAETDVGPAPAAKPPGAPGLSTTAAGTPFARKATMLGLGATSTPPPSPSNPPAAGSPPRTTFATTPSVPPRPGGGTAMFPKTDPSKEMPAKEEQTVMRQAAELLEDALREAGGSMAEIGTNPLFSGTAGPPGARAQGLQTPSTPASEWTAADTPQALAATVAAIREEATAHEEAGKRRADSTRSPRPTPTSIRPAAAQVRVSEPAPKAKKKGTGTLAIVVVAAAAAVGAVMFRDKLFGSSAPAEPVAASATPEPTSTPVATAIASASTTPVPPTATVSAAPLLSANTTPSAQPPAVDSAAPSVTASAASAENAASKPSSVVSVVPPPPAPRPRPAAAKPPAAAPAEGAGAAATATASATETATASPSPTESAAAPPAPQPAKPPPAPKPAKPAKPADDNPY